MEVAHLPWSMRICFYLVNMVRVIHRCALNKKNGSVARTEKDRSSDSKKNFSFCTPLVVPRGNDYQIISPASDYVFSYALNGEEL